MQKFLFDRLNFDHGPGYELEHPPEPTFSMAEVEAARADGIVQGRNIALKEAQESRDQKIVELTQKISGAVTQLLSAEKARDDMYQDEAAKLAVTLFEKTFPILKKMIGADQILGTIRSVMSELDEKAVVTIEVSTDDLSEVSDRLKPLLLQHEGQLTIIPQTDLSAGACRLKWAEGGMVQNPDETAQKLLAVLQETLKNIIDH